jgi:hypothetical protein
VFIRPEVLTSLSSRGLGGPRSEMVGSGGNAPLVASSKFCDTGFTGRLLGRFLFNSWRDELREFRLRWGLV